MSDIAKQAGVSKFTASVVINGSRSNTKVSESTRLRVQGVAAELNYRPNAIAQSLALQRTDVVGFYSSFETVNTRNLFLADIVGGIQAACKAYQKDMLFVSAIHGGSIEATYAKLVNRKVDALVLFSENEDKLMDRLSASDLPVVSIVNPWPNLPCVAVDDAQGARMQAEHLATLGHKRVLYRTAPATVSLEKMTAVSRRLTAFERAAHELGMTVTVTRDGAMASRAPDWNSFLTEEEKAALFGPKNERPTAVACWSDGSAHAFVAYCYDRGLRIPDDLAVIGFDGYPYWGHIECARFPLTTIVAPWNAVAMTAVELVHDRLNGKDIPMELLLPVTLHIGKTT